MPDQALRIMTASPRARRPIGPVGLVLGLLLLGCVCAAENARSEAITVVDDRGHTVSLKQSPPRIVSLLPSLTESVCELGGCARIVGADRYSDWPPSLGSVPKVGGLEDASLERIVSLHPDLVLAGKSSRVIDRLDELGIPVIALEANSIAGAHRVLLLTATLLGNAAVGPQAWQRMQSRIAAAAAQVPARMRGESVYFEVSEAPYAAGASSFIGELLEMLGLSNAVPGNLGPFPKLNPEFVVRAQPSIIMAPSRELAGMVDRPGWRDLRALQRGRTCAFPTDRFEVIERPGPRLGEAAEIIVSCLLQIDRQATP